MKKKKKKQTNECVKSPDLSDTGHWALNLGDHSAFVDFCQNSFFFFDSFQTE